MNVSGEEPPQKETDKMATRSYVHVSDRLAAFFVRKYNEGWGLAKIANSGIAKRARQAQGATGGFPVGTVRNHLLAAGVTMRGRGRPVGS